jgi:hypothetical protein
LSVVENSRLRKVDPWYYVATVLIQAHRGIKYSSIPIQQHLFLLKNYAAMPELGTLTGS